MNNRVITMQIRLGTCPCLVKNLHTVIYLSLYRMRVRITLPTCGDEWRSVPKSCVSSCHPTRTLLRHSMWVVVCVIVTMSCVRSMDRYELHSCCLVRMTLMCSVKVLAVLSLQVSLGVVKYMSCAAVALEECHWGAEWGLCHCHCMLYLL